MASNILRTTTTRTTKKAVCLTSQSSYSTRGTSWFTRFLSPSEEKKLYLGITSSFREKLVEQSNKSAQTYSHIIEHALLTTKPTNKVSRLGVMSIARMEQLKIDLDTAGKQKDIAKLQQLQLEMDRSNLDAITIYNRLIRSYIWSNSIEHAEQVLKGLKDRDLVPSSRTFTYFIQEYLKKDQLNQAKPLVEQMQHLSLLRLRNEFDCSVMLKYYKAAGDSHAVDFLWRDIMLHEDTIKPSNALYTSYLEHLLTKQQEVKPIAQLTQNFITLIQQSSQPLQPHHYITWIKAVNALAKAETHQAENLLILLMNKAPSKMGWGRAKEATTAVVTSYLNKDQELKALAFYYKLGKMGIHEQAFEPHVIQSIQSTLKNLERQDNKAVIAELEGLAIAP